MARCAMCDKDPQFGNQISHSRSLVSGRSAKMWKQNIRSVRVNVNGNSQKLYLCAACLRNLRKTAEA